MSGLILQILHQEFSIQSFIGSGEMPKSHIRSQPKGFLKSCELHRATDHNLSELLTRGHDSDAP